MPLGPGEEPRFLVDRMLVKLGKYLRIVGLDAVWPEAGTTRDLVRRADAEGRVFLTRNARFAEMGPVPERWLWLASTDPVVGLRSVLESLGIEPGARLFSRCIRCNLELNELCDLGALAARVPARVRERHDRFWTCPGCGTVFWRGTHVANTCRKLGLELPGPEPER